MADGEGLSRPRSRSPLGAHPSGIKGLTCSDFESPLSCFYVICYMYFSPIDACLSSCILLQYANRLPIGLKDVIQCCSADVVRAFFERWYRPEHQAVIATGDFDPDAVVAMLTEKLECCKSRDESPVPAFPRSAPLSSVHNVSRLIFKSAVLASNSLLQRSGAHWRHMISRASRFS